MYTLVTLEIYIFNPGKVQSIPGRLPNTPMQAAFKKIKLDILAVFHEYIQL